MKTLGLTIVEFDLATHTHQKLDLNAFAINEQEPNKIYWVHYNLSSNEENFTTLITKLHLPEKVIELCYSEDPMPKLLEADETVTLQIQCLLSNDMLHSKAENFSNLIIHLTDRFCFTASNDPIPALLEFEDYYDKALKYAITPCFILFLILDNAVNDYAMILYSFELIVDRMDLKIRASHENIYAEVMDVKRHLMKIKRYTVAIREILMRLSGRKITVISNQCRSSLYNLFNQSQMVFHEADSVRDILNGLLDQIDNSLMQNMNETMRVLTAFAAIFLPLSLITGIYGMNFRWIPELQWQYGYFWALGLIVVCGFALLWIFKKKKWF